MNKLPNQIQKLAEMRKKLKSEKNYSKSDRLREIIEAKGYAVVDSNGEQRITVKINKSKNTEKSSLIAVFGSGEMSPTGRKIHEYLVKDLPPPVKIAMLETPTGFEQNPHHWYEKLEEMMLVGLQNYKPIITKVAALRREGPNNTNDELILKPLLEAAYLHTGAGSPSYAAKHLKDTLAFRYLSDAVHKKVPISFASATAVALSQYLLPVYEIYKVGEDLHWKEGLNFLKQWGFNITFIPHWNNTEGGKYVDTSRCYMGKERFEKLLKILPGPTTILGIDEQTACIFDLNKKEIKLMGNGGITIQKNSEKMIIRPNSKVALNILN